MSASDRAASGHSDGSQPRSSDAPSSRYRRIAVLGQGGMARVLLVHARSAGGVDKLLVVKELRPELENEPEFLAMFLNEARIAARLNHPNVMQTYEVSQEGAHHVLVMEYLDGQPWNHVIARVGRKTLPLDLHVRVLADALAGLHYAHDLRDFDGTPLEIVHRDVSPHNVFVTYEGVVKIVDFGIAKIAGAHGGTRTGVFKGKLGYAAPEQVAGTALDRRADVFAVGVMLWEAIAGRRMTPPGEPEAVLMARRLAGADTKLVEAAPDAPPELVSICDKALARNPDDRFETAAAMRAALERFLEGRSRAGQAELAKLLGDAFTRERVEMRAKIDAGMKTAEGPEPRSRPPVEAPSETPPPASTAPSTNTVATAPRAAPPLAEPSPPSSTVRTLLVVAGVLATALAFVVVWRVGAQAGASTTGDPIASSRPASSATPNAEPLAVSVDLSVSADPPAATIFLDDAALGASPFHGPVPRAATARKLRVAAPGYVSEERSVVLDRDLHLELALKRDAGQATTAGSTAQAPVATNNGHRPGAPRATSAPADTSIAPGMDLKSPRGAPSAQHTIDDHL